MDPTVALRVSEGHLSPPGLGEVQEVLPGTELVGRPVPLAPTFQPTDAMIQGAVWPGREPPPCQRDLGGSHRAISQCCLCWGAQPGCLSHWGPGAGGGSQCWRGVPVMLCAPRPRAAGHGVAGPDPGAAPWPRDVVPGRGPHDQQHPSLRPLVPPGCPSPGQAPRVRRGRNSGDMLGWVWSWWWCWGSPWDTGHLSILPAAAPKRVCCSSTPRGTGTRRHCSSCWW